MPQINTSEFILKPEGIIIRRNVQEVEIDASPGILAELANTSPQWVRELGEVDGLRVRYCSVNKTAYASADLKTLSLNSTFKVTKDLVEAGFENVDNTPMRVTWEAPEDMRLVYAVRLETKTGGKYGLHYNGLTNYLVAFNKKDGAGYRLPMPNLYDDCSICTGTYDHRGDSVLEAFKRNLDYIIASPWNNHIIKDYKEDQKHSHQLFRWKPVEAGFQTLPPEEHWAKLCNPSGSDMFNYIV